MTNEQIAILVVPLVLALLGQIAVLIYGFRANNRRLDDIICRLDRMEAK